MVEGCMLPGEKDTTDHGCGPVTLNSGITLLTPSSGDNESVMFFFLFCQTRVDRDVRVPQMAPNIEVNLSGLLGLGKSDLCVLRGADGNVMGIHDFLCLPEWTSAEVQEDPHLDVRSTLQRLPFYCTPPATADVVISDPTIADLTVSSPSSKILAKAETSQKQ
ncbi:hypothetical protein Tco_1322091, partial [Tanacetum coccineum]